MFEAQHRNTNFRSALAMVELIYVSTVRHVRKSHRNPILGLLSNMLQTFMFVAAFWLFYAVLGIRGMAIRGDFVLYLLSGIFLFLTHTKAVAAVAKSEGPTSPMMMHAPMNTAIAITSSALSSLYLQTLSAIVILFMVHVAWHPVVIDKPMGTIAMFLLAWFSGVAVGLVFLAIKPFYPGVSGFLTTLYSRANMIASGKMFVANSMPSSMIVMFDWNPLFHAIDQARGFTFINYNPMFTDYMYTIYVALVLLMIGLMGEFQGRRYASVSWSAGR
ncbi:MAG: ABC transporter permease [Pseudomonadota bacterium]